MAWTLLRASQSEPETRETPFDERPYEEPPPASPLDGHVADETLAKSPPFGAGAGTTQAWILMGGPTRALYQSGIAERLLERLGPPRIAYGCGIGTVNAVLAAAGKSTELREGWEALRAMHFLTDIALTSLPVVGTSFAASSRRHRLLMALPEARPALDPDATTTVILIGDDGLLRPLAAAGPADLDARVATALEQRRLDSTQVARAIRDAVARRVARVILVGIGDGDDTGALSAEVARARAQRVEVVSLPYLPTAPPGWLDFMLPATGAVDRTIRDGRRAADRWLADQSAPGVSGDPAESSESTAGG